MYCLQVQLQVHKFSHETHNFLSIVFESLVDLRWDERLRDIYTNPAGFCRPCFCFYFYFQFSVYDWGFLFYGLSTSQVNAQHLI